MLYVPVGTARDLAQDLAAAGIPLVTEHGKAVFHSLRITYINLVLDLGVNPKEGATTGPTLDDKRLRTDTERVFERGCGAVVRVGVCNFCASRGVEEPLPLMAVGDAEMPKGGFEPPRPVRHHPLKMACLPFPPLRHACTLGNTGFQDGKTRQHSACVRPLSTALSGRRTRLLRRFSRRCRRGCVFHRR